MLTTAPSPCAARCGTARLRQQERGRDVEPQRGFERTLARLEHRAGEPAARVVHQDVDAAELADRGVDEAVQIVGDGHVGAHRETAAAACADRGRSRVDVGLGAGGTDDVGAGFGQTDRNAGADALARAGDDGDAAVESESIEDHGALLRAEQPPNASVVASWPVW